MKRALKKPVVFLPLLAAACIGADSESSSWGVGEDPGCDRSSDQCWDETDRAALTSAVNDLNEVMAATDQPAALRTVVTKVRALSHKLNESELAALDAEEARLAEASPTLSDEATAATVASLRHRALHRLENGMISAHMAPVEDAIVDYVERDPCETAAVGCAGPDDGGLISIPAHYPQGTRDALSQIAGSSLFGKVIATMLITNGSLDMDYEVENARLFGEYNEQTGEVRDSGLSPAARVQRIVDRAQNLAFWAGAVAGAESLVPLAGIAISIGHEEWMLFEIHSKMIFRIAQVYGWDVRSGPSLINAVTLIMGDGLLLEGTDILLSNIALPLVVRQIGARFGYRTADQLVGTMTGNFSRRLLGIISAKARKKLTQEVVEGGVKAVARQLFGWITFGATIAISAGTDYYFTGTLGHRVMNTAKRWLGDFLHEGSTFLGRDEARECAFSLYGRMAAADGNVAELERKLYQAYMGNDYWVSETLHWPLARPELVAHAARFKEIWDQGGNPDFLGGVDSCLDVAFADADEQHRMTLLAFLHAMMHIDGDETLVERQIYNSYRTKLRGPMFRRLDDDLMNQIERTVLAEIRLPNTDIAAEYGIALTDFIPALEVKPEIAHAYAEAHAP